MLRNSFPGLAHYSNGLCRERDIRHRRVKMECLQAGRQRVVYLITYKGSRADVVKFPSKESFSNAVLQARQNFGVRVVKWVMCIEAHHNTDNAENGREMNLYHYLMAIKLEKRVWVSNTKVFRRELRDKGELLFIIVTKNHLSPSPKITVSKFIQIARMFSYWPLEN